MSVRLPHRTDPTRGRRDAGSAAGRTAVSAHGGRPAVPDSMVQRLLRRPMTGPALRAVAGAGSTPVLGAAVRAAAQPLLELDRLRAAPLSGVPPWTPALATAAGADAGDAG